MYKENVHKPDLRNGYYLNPIISGDCADPAVMREGEDFYLCASTGAYYPALTIYHATDLVNWRPICNPLNNKINLQIYAPDLFKYDGLYYLYFTSMDSNWVMTSPHIDRGWSEPIDLKVGYIDPGHCFDEAGNRYLFLSGGHMAPLAPDGLSVMGPVEKVFEAPPIPDAWDVEGRFPEAPNLFQKDGWHYLTYADGGTGGPATSHMIMCARARDLRGPWEVSPHNPIVHTWHRTEKWISKGHGHFVEDSSGDWWVLYHAYENGRHAEGRKLLLSPVVFTEDGWFRADTPADEAAPKPAGKAGDPPPSLSDTFADGEMPPQWKCYGAYDPARFQRIGGELRMEARGSCVGDSNPLTVTPGDHSFWAAASVEAGAGCAAGLVYLYDERFYNAALLREGVLTLYRVGKVLTTLDVGPGVRYLRMKVDEGYLCFYYGEDEKTLRKANYVIDTTSQNALAYGGFLSLRVGLCAVGEGTAWFGRFTYQGLK